MGIKGEHQNDERSTTPSRFDAHFFFLKISSARFADVYIDIKFKEVMREQILSGILSQITTSNLIV